MSLSTAKSAAGRHGVQLGYNLLTIMAGVAILGLGFAYGIDALSRMKHQKAATGDERKLTRTMAGKDLEIPAFWFRFDEQKVEGFAKQIDLTLDLPLGKDGASARIEVSLVPQSRARPSASLLDGVYLHQFSKQQLSGPPGLIGKPLTGAEGFENETVWYDPLSANPFVAKCIAPITADQPGRCLRTVPLIKGMAAVYTFDSDILANWRQFDAEMTSRFKQIGVF
jgi:hypothetical protein